MNNSDSKARAHFKWGLLAALTILFFWLLPQATKPPLPVHVSVPVVSQQAAEPEVVEQALSEQLVVVPTPVPEAPTEHIVKKGETLFGIAKDYGVEWKPFCVENRLNDCNVIMPGQKLTVIITDEAKERVKQLPARFFEPKYRYSFTDCSKTKRGFCVFSRPGGDKVCNMEVTILKRDFGLSDEEARSWLAAPKERMFLKAGTMIDGLSFGHGYWQGPVLVKQDMWYVEGRIGERTFGQFEACCNFFPIAAAPTSTVEAVPVEQEPPVVTESAPLAEEPPAEVVPEAEAEEEMIEPFHITAAEAAGKPRCEVQAGLGIYGNRVYEGNWVYGETICYIWKDGEWQAGPGLYAMFGSGASTGSAFHNKEYGVGFQLGIQRNWVNGRNHLATFDLKGRLLYDKSWGANPDSGYHFSQKGLKLGIYTGYAEKINNEGDLVGVIGEYWKSFGGSVKSTWAAQPVQDRGSLGAAVFYETKISDDNLWRIRYIGGVKHTNWDKQNWLQLTPEFRYDDWLMFGPQLTLPLGISHLNQPLSHGDLTTIGAFMRVELGKKIREIDANNREGQLEFIPAEGASEPPSDGQLEFVPPPAATP